MPSHFHSFANRIAALLMKALFGCVARVHVVRSENANHDGGFLLAANHISHFDPFIISSAIERKIDWMAMAEFFRFPLLGFLLRAVDAFPADRDRADRKTIRTAIERLKSGRVDRKSTRLNSSHSQISYAVFCLKKQNNQHT